MKSKIEDADQVSGRCPAASLFFYVSVEFRIDHAVFYTAKVRK
jgi:hypothetical protein